MANLTVRMDDKLKKDLEAQLASMGMNTSTAVTILAKAIVKTGRFPIEIVGDPFYSEGNMKRLSQAIKDLEDGKGTEHELIEVEDEEDMA